MTYGEMAAIAAAMVTFLAFALTSIQTAAKIGRMAGIMETSLQNQNVLIGELRDDIKVLSDVIATQAVQTTRMDTLGAMLVEQSKRISELAHGEGFVIPMTAGYPPKTKLG